MSPTENDPTPASVVAGRRLGGVGLATCDACCEAIAPGERAIVAVSRSLTGPWTLYWIRCTDCGPHTDHCDHCERVYRVETERRPDPTATVAAVVAVAPRLHPDVEHVALFDGDAGEEPTGSDGDGSALEGRPA